MTEIKLCVYCQHCEHEGGGCGSEWTGCWSGFYNCNCNHFRTESEDIFEGWAYQAMSCPDYQLSDKIKAEIEKFK